MSIKLPSRPALLLALLTTFGVVVLGASAGGAAPVAGQSDATIDPSEPYVAGEVLVQYRGQEVPEKVELRETADVEAVAQKIEDRPAVEYATPNYIAEISSWLPNDRGVNARRAGQVAGWQQKQWNFLPCLSLCRSGASVGNQSLGGINTVRAWRELRKAGRPGAAGVKVAVLDTGVAYRDYRNGFRRDPDLREKSFIGGFDFVDDDRRPLDRNGHGTHITSTISQATNNRRGLTGIAYGAKIMPVRVMDAYGYGTTEHIVQGIRWAANHGARVISMSINFQCGLAVPPLEEALRYAHRKGAVLVGSSGNKGAVTCPSLPATAKQVISVGGSTESGCVAKYSFKSSAIDIAAPGGGSSGDECPAHTGNRPILQMAMLGADPTRFSIESGWKGTSMAAAHVAGAAAMVLASGVLKDGTGPQKVEDRLTGSARLPAYAATDQASGFGAGILNLGKAVNPEFEAN